MGKQLALIIGIGLLGIAIPGIANLLSPSLGEHFICRLVQVILILAVISVIFQPEESMK